jgi:hypothetical protein
MRTVRNPILIVIIILSLVLGLDTLTRGQDWGDDFASYIMQAQSISNGTIQTFMQHNAFAVNKSFGYIGPVAYPWGYPLILVPAYLLRGVHPIVLKLPVLFFFAGFLVCLYFWMKSRFTPTESLIIVSLFAFNPMLIRFLDYIVSDIPFLFFSTLTLLFLSSDKRFTMIGSIWIGLSIGFAFFIRKQGILLLPGYIAALVWDVRKNKIDADNIKMLVKHVFVISLTFALIWLTTALIFPGEGGSYFAQYGAFQFQTVVEFIGRYAVLFGSFYGDHWAWQILYWVTVVFFLFGAWTTWNDEKHLHFFFVIWMLFLITWPFWQGERFIFPLLPIYVYFVFSGMKTAIARLPLSLRQVGTTSFYTFWVVVSVVFLFTSSIGAYTNLRANRDSAGPFDAYSDEMFNFIRDNTSSDSVVIFFKPRAMSLFTGRYSMRVIECSHLRDGNYVSIHKKWDNSQILPDQIDECGVPLKHVYENRRFVVYEILK